MAKRRRSVKRWKNAVLLESMGSKIPNRFSNPTDYMEYVSKLHIPKPAIRDKRYRDDPRFSKHYGELFSRKRYSSFFASVDSNLKKMRQIFLEYYGEDSKQAEALVALADSFYVTYRRTVKEKLPHLTPKGFDRYQQLLKRANWILQRKGRRELS